MPGPVEHRALMTTQTGASKSAISLGMNRTERQNANVKIQGSYWPSLKEPGLCGDRVEMEGGCG